VCDVINDGGGKDIEDIILQLLVFLENRQFQTCIRIVTLDFEANLLSVPEAYWWVGVPYESALFKGTILRVETKSTSHFVHLQPTDAAGTPGVASSMGLYHGHVEIGGEQFCVHDHGQYAHVRPEDVRPEARGTLAPLVTLMESLGGALGYPLRAEGNGCALIASVASLANCGVLDICSWLGPMPAEPRVDPAREALEAYLQGIASGAELSEIESSGHSVQWLLGAAIAQLAPPSQLPDMQVFTLHLTGNGDRGMRHTVTPALRLEGQVPLYAAVVALPEGGSQLVGLTRAWYDGGRLALQKGALTGTFLHGGTCWRIEPYRPGSGLGETVIGLVRRWCQQTTRALAALHMLAQGLQDICLGVHRIPVSSKGNVKKVDSTPLGRGNEPDVHLAFITKGESTRAALLLDPGKKPWRTDLRLEHGKWGRGGVHRQAQPACARS
jgi:hypothetical protein